MRYHIFISFYRKKAADYGEKDYGEDIAGVQGIFV